MPQCRRLVSKAGATLSGPNRRSIRGLKKRFRLELIAVAWPLAVSPIHQSLSFAADESCAAHDLSIYPVRTSCGRVSRMRRVHLQMAAVQKDVKLLISEGQEQSKCGEKALSACQCN